LELTEGGIPELSEQFGLFQLTLTLSSVALRIEISVGQKPQVGGSVSFTSTVKVQLFVFLAASVTVYFTVFVPIPNSFGRLVSTFLSLIFSTTVKESFVIPGSL